MGKKNRKTEKVVLIKTKEERKAELLTVMKQLNELGLSKEIDGIAEFYKLCQEYIETGEGQSGKIKLVGFKRELVYILPKRKEVKVNVNLVYNKDV